MRVRNTTIRKKRHKRKLSLAKGYRLGHSTLFRSAKEALQRAWKYAYISRRLKKRSFKQLWNNRISAILKDMGLSYSKVIGILNKKNVLLNKKMLSQLASNYPEVLKNIINNCIK